MTAKYTIGKVISNAGLSFDKIQNKEYVSTAPNDVSLISESRIFKLYFFSTGLCKKSPEFSILMNSALLFENPKNIVRKKVHITIHALGVSPTA